MKRNQIHSFALIAFAVGAVVVGGKLATAQEAPTAGPEHKLLQELEGTWDAEIKTADGAQTSKGVSTYKMELGGLWLVSEFKGSFGDFKFEGRGVDGYDTNKKKYVGVWVDSMTTSPMLFEGTYDAKTRTMTMKGEGTGPDGMTAKFKTTTTTSQDKNSQTFKMYMIDGSGTEQQMMTIEYKRRKA